MLPPYSVACGALTTFSPARILPLEATVVPISVLDRPWTDVEAGVLRCATAPS